VNDSIIRGRKSRREARAAKAGLDSLCHCAAAGLTVLPRSTWLWHPAYNVETTVTRKKSKVRGKLQRTAKLGRDFPIIQGSHPPTRKKRKVKQFIRRAQTNNHHRREDIEGKSVNRALFPQREKKKTGELKREP